MEKKLLITGANGFVGRALLDYFAPKMPVIALGKRPILLPQVENRILDDLFFCTSKHFENAHTLIHCAARAHVLKERNKNPQTIFQRENVDVLRNVLEAASRTSIQRVIFLSSSKIYGEKSLENQSFSETSPANPSDFFAQSKWQAETLLTTYQNRFHIHILRLPLLYGPHPKAHWAMLLKAVERGIPLPLKAFQTNRRSFLSLLNLCDFLEKVTFHSKEHQIFNLSDGQDLSTACLLEKLAHARHHAPRLFYVPPAVLHAFARLLQQEKRLSLLENSFVLNIEKAKQMGWNPPWSVDAAFEHYFSPRSGANFF